MIPMRKLARAPSRTGVRYWQLFWQRLDSFHRCNNASLHPPTTLPAYQGPHSPPSSTLASVNLKAFRPYSPNEFGKDSPMPLPPCPASARGRRGLLLVKLLHRDATVTPCAPDSRLPVVFLYPTHSSRADPAVVLSGILFRDESGRCPILRRSAAPPATAQKAWAGSP